MTAHTIILVQSTVSPSDCETVALAMDKIASIFEDHLLEENPRLTELQYSAEDLLRFIDQHKEFVALVFEGTTNTYKPHDQVWIKERLISHLTNKHRPTPSSRHTPATPPSSSYHYRGKGRRH